MTEKEAAEKLNCVANETVSSMAGLMLGIASTAATMIKDRIQKTGINAEGQAFPPYSTQYAKYRKKHGRQIGFVDFAFSGRMWSNVQVISSDAEHSQGTARISAMGDDYRKILSGNTERKGVILDLNDIEVEFLQSQVEKWVTGIFHNCGL